VCLDLELERSQCNLTTNVHLEHSLGSHLQHELGWSSLHIASVNNSVSIIRVKRILINVYVILLCRSW